MMFKPTSPAVHATEMALNTPGNLGRRNHGMSEHFSSFASAKHVCPTPGHFNFSSRRQTSPALGQRFCKGPTAPLLAHSRVLSLGQTPDMVYYLKNGVDAVHKFMRPRTMAPIVFGSAIFSRSSGLCLKSIKKGILIYSGSP
jgi:hypothetical protein